MILTCPQCATRYQIEDAKFPPGGRNVRCAKCGHRWFQAPPEPEPGLEISSEMRPSAALAASAVAATPPLVRDIEPEAPRVTPSPSPLPPVPQPQAAPVPPVPPAARRARGERTAVAAGWIGLAAILLLVVWGGVRYRDAIASVWPRTSSLYAAMGMPVNTRGIAFTGVSYRRDTEAGQPVLTVNGTLVNVSGRDVPVPRIEVTLTDDRRHKLDRWVFSPGVQQLKPGERIAFATRRTNPPSQARHLEMEFAGAGG